MSAYSFTKNQLKVLLKGIGCSRICGLDLNDSFLEDSVTLNILNDLALNGVISNGGNSFIIREDVRKILDILALAEKYLIIRTSIPELPDICCYLKEDMLKCEYSISNVDIINIEYTDKGSFFCNLIDEGYFLEVTEKNVYPEDKILERFESENNIDVKSINVLDRNSLVLFSATLIDKGKVLRSVNVIDYCLYPYILSFESGNFFREKFSTGVLEEYINLLLNV